MEEDLGRSDWHKNLSPLLPSTFEGSGIAIFLESKLYSMAEMASFAIVIASLQSVPFRNAGGCGMLERGNKPL